MYCIGIQTKTETICGIIRDYLRSGAQVLCDEGADLYRRLKRVDVFHQRKIAIALMDHQLGGTVLGKVWWQRAIVGKSCRASGDILVYSYHSPSGGR